MPIYSFEGRIPAIHPTAYIAPTAEVIGDVTVGAHCYVGFGAILRGDYGTIVVGDGTAIEEGVIVHARPTGLTTFENDVTLGHGAMIHNATIREGALIGMYAVVSDFSEVGAWSIVGEAALVKRGQQIPARVLAVGVPAKVVRELEEKNLEEMRWAKELYKDLAKRYPTGLEEISRKQIKLPEVT
jgi:phenylacetic acid degradation protein